MFVCFFISLFIYLPVLPHVFYFILIILFLLNDIESSEYLFNQVVF